jgi:hypothetical protein
MSEPDDAPLDEEPTPETDAPAATSNVLSPVDAGLAGAIKGMYALWRVAQPDAGAEESRQAFLAVVGSALADV